MIVRISEAAQSHLDDIFAYSVENWGWERAKRYSSAIIDTFEQIAARKILWRRVPSKIATDGYGCRSGSHFVYWRVTSVESVTIVAILHNRMHQSDRLRRAFDENV